MLIQGTLTFEHVPIAAMPDLLRAFSHLAEIARVPCAIFVKGTGATREGRIVNFSSRWYPLLDTSATARRQFYLIFDNENGENILLRPENDVFSEVRLTFEVEKNQM
jgi:hypothetical protein